MCITNNILLSKKIIAWAFIAWAFHSGAAYAQCPNIQSISLDLKNVISEKLDSSKKLDKLYHLKKSADSCMLIHDSVYAELLFQTAKLEFKVNKDYNKSIQYTLQAFQINSSGKPGSSKISAVKNALQMALSYKEINLYSKALSYYDTVKMIAPATTVSPLFKLYSMSERSYLFFLTGDYQKSIEESFLGEKYSLQQNDSSYYVSFLNQKVQSYFFQKQIAKATEILDEIIKLSIRLNEPFQLASAYKIKAMICENQKDYDKAEYYYKESIKTRISTKDTNQITTDYSDLGSFYSGSSRNFSEAKRNYFISMNYAKKTNNFSKLAMININLGETSLSEYDYKNAGKYFTKALEFLNVKDDDNLLTNPKAKQLNLIGNKEYAITIMSDKVKLLLQLYKTTNNTIYLSSCIKTAYVTDSVITQTRHEQLEEQSKLYWRNYTREFFTTTMEACFLAGDTKSAFHFMEKSRAVLLNDKLNELGALAHLPEKDGIKERDLQISIITEEQKLNTLTPNTTAYDNQFEILLKVKDEFDHFIKSLEKKYPVYYSYKYADAVPTFDSLQKFLSVNNSSFIHYFTNDTVAYILSITANNAKILKLAKKDFNFKQINSFLLFCSNKDSLNAFYPAFATLSNNLYKSLFQPLQISKGRVVICSDNFLLPFEALCSDTAGKDFLINDYTFSYAYSATYLLKQTTPSNAEGNFIGFAPVSFQPYLNVPSLKNSAAALTQSSAYYSNTLLFKDVTATKNNFIQHIGDYTVANVFSHASADNSVSEPKLYMQDSLIQLSDLQLLDHPATRLVVLSACQTNVGKNATGEGIYSLARGFASAGIPSVSATLWKADEDMIYIVSAKFNEYLSQGMSKDSALQKAKLDFLKTNGNSDKSLPYYWANIILIGNTEPLKLSSDASTNWWWMAIGTVAAILALGMVAAIVRRQHIAQ